MAGHPTRPMARRASGASLLPCGLLALAAYGSSQVTTAFTFRVLPARRCSLARRALPDVELSRQIQDHLLSSDPSLAVLGTPLQGWADAVAAEVGSRAAEAANLFGPPLPAYADAAEAPVLDPNVKYVMGPDGNVLIDPMSNKPITDDWWNGIIGFQADLIKGLDSKLRDFGVVEAFGWTIVLYTLFVKLLFYPLQQGQLRSTAMMQLLAPKVKEVQERYKNEPETMQRLVGQLYTTMDVNPLGGCLPLLVQLPLFWSLYGVWRRLSAEHFPHYEESWLWVPSLAKPNPDFQFKLDWVWQFQDGAPVMGWHDYLCYLIFPVLLVGFTLVSQQQAQAGKTQGQDDGNLVMKALPFISVYFIGALSMELPQAVSVYYATNTALTLAQTSLTKYTLRQEIPGYEEFERTGKFPDSAFESAVMANAPAPKTLHEAAVRGSLPIVKKMYQGDGTEAAEAGKEVDINAWDDKEIAPIGYAVACGHVDLVRYFIEKGANLQVLDGQKNTLLHYAAGYGHKEVLEVLLEAGSDIWPDNEWSQWRNAKNQTVVDAACANRKGAILDFLSERLVSSAAGEDADSEEGKRTLVEVFKARSALLKGKEADSKTVETEPSTSSPAPQQPASDAEVTDGQARPSPTMTSAMRNAMAELKANPKAVEQAKQAMSKMPPQLLSMLSGNKLSAEQAKKYMDNIQNMSTEDILEKVDDAGDLLTKGGVAAVAPAAGSAAVAPRREGKSVPARAVD